MNHFLDKVVWITGASSGIGEALAYALSPTGAKLIISSRRTEELERVRTGCARPENVSILPLDLADPAGLKGCSEAAISFYGKIDIMVHNGGISQRSLVEETEMSVHRKLMEVDYFSYVEITRQLLPHFFKRNTGHFVVISSVMGKIGTPMRSAYAAAKHALHGFFDCLRAEVSPRNIKVTIITPGYIRTKIAFNALTAGGASLGKEGKDILEGYPAEKAARQILHAVAAGKYEAFTGKIGKEKMALLMNRWTPAFLKKLAPRLIPK